MRSLFVVATLCGIWMLVDGASVITPDPQLWGNTSITEFQKDCIAKIQNEKNLVIDSLNMKFTFLTVFIKITQNIRGQNSLDSLDTMINDICYPALDEEKLYSLTMEILKICMNLEDPFTAEEKKMVKNKLEYTFCNLYMKLAAIATFSPDCISDATTINKISKCTEGQTFSTTSPRSWFFGDNVVCATQSKAIDCINQAIKGQCSANISERIGSLLAEARSTFGCDSELNSIATVSSL